MSSTTGIKDGDFDRLNVAFDMGVGLDNDFGENGQVLISGGENEPLRWGSNSATAPNPLRAGTHTQIVRTSDASDLGSYDGSIDATITAENTIYQADKGVEIDDTTSPETIKAKVDDTTPTTQTISNSGGTGSDELNVLRVPNSITFVDDGSGATTGTFDGSGNLTIETSGTYQADLGVEIDTTTQPDTIKAKVDIDVANPTNQTITNNFNNDTLKVLRVPNNLSANLGLKFEVGTDYDGSALRTIITKVDDTTPASQTISNTGGTGADELNVLRVPGKLQADNNTITIGGVLTGDYDGSVNHQIAVHSVPNTLTIQNGNTTIAFDGSADKSITIAQGSIDHTQVSRIGQQLAQAIHSFPFYTTVPSMTTNAFQPLPGWGIEGLTAVATDYLIELSFQMFSPGSTTTSSGTFVRGVMRLDKTVGSTSTSAWGSANGIYSPVMFGGVKIVGGIFTFNNVNLTTGMSLWNGRVHYTYVVSNLTIGNSYNFIPKFYSYTNTNNTRSAFSISYGGINGFSTCSAIPIGINSPDTNTVDTSITETHQFLGATDTQTTIPQSLTGIGGLGGIYRDITNGFLYRFLLPSDFLNDNDSSGYARSVISDSNNHGSQQTFAGSQFYAFFTIPEGYYFSGFRVNLVNSAGTNQGSTPSSSLYVNVYTKNINGNLSVSGTTKGFNTDNLGYTITSGYSDTWTINDSITIGAIHCFRSGGWSSSFYNRGGWIQYTQGTPPPEPEPEDY